MRKSPTPPRTPFTPRSFTSLPALKNAPDGEILSDSDLPFLSKSNIPLRTAPSLKFFTTLSSMFSTHATISSSFNLEIVNYKVS